MKNFTKLLVLFVISAFIVLLGGCKSCESTKEEPQLEEGSPVEEFREISKRANEIYYRFPTPDEMFTFVNSSGLEFDYDLLNPIENLNKYVDSKSQMLNLGIYTADLGYITLFKKYKESINYFDVLQNLSDKLRISSAFDKALMERIENNLKNVDSLKAISNDSYSQMINYLVENDKEKTFAVISIGAYVEFLYITLHLIGEYSEDNETIQRIAEQKYAFENLYFYTEEFKDDPVVAEIFPAVERLKASIDKISEIKEATNVEKNEDGKLVFGGGTKIKMTKDQFLELKEVSSSIRKSIVASLN